MSQTLTSTRHEVAVNLDQQLIIMTNVRPEPDYDVPFAIGFPSWNAWGWGDTVVEAIENLVFTDPMFPTDVELENAKALYGAVKAAHPELTPNDPKWWEEQ